MDAIVTAGGLQSDTDPLYQKTGIRKKALTPLCGQPMVGWVIQALLDSGEVDNVVLIGLTQSDLPNLKGPLHFLDSAGSIVANARSAISYIRELSPESEHVLLATSDIPLLTGDIVRDHIAACHQKQADCYYAAVEEKTMERRMPGAKRSYIPFKGGRYTGGDLFMAVSDIDLRADVDLIRSLADDRKNYFKQIRKLGLGFILRFLLRRLTIHDAAAYSPSVANFSLRVIDSPHVELAMDVDKPHQYDLIKSELENKLSHSIPVE